jgi:hypothetical protein
MQTSIEWLIQEVEPYGTGKFRDLFKEVIEQAKKMHKAEHGKTWDTALDKYEVRAGNYMRAYEDFDDYFQETFVSKGSDDHKYYEQSRGINVNSFDSVAPKKDKYIVKVTEVELPQQEISDEEIEKGAIEYYNSPVGNLDREIGFRYACKWYREQLKIKTLKTEPLNIDNFLKAFD